MIVNIEFPKAPEPIGSYKAGVIRRALVNEIIASEQYFFTPTTLNGHFVIRVAISNWQTGPETLLVFAEALEKAYQAVGKTYQELVHTWDDER